MSQQVATRPHQPPRRSTTRNRLADLSAVTLSEVIMVVIGAAGNLHHIRVISPCPSHVCANSKAKLFESFEQETIHEIMARSLGAEAGFEEGEEGPGSGPRGGGMVDGEYSK